MRRIRPLLVLALAALAFVSVRQTQRASECSSRGGTYDRATGRCDAATFQGEPARAPMRHRQVLGGAVVVALLGAGVAVYLTRRGRRRRVS